MKRAKKKLFESDALTLDFEKSQPDRVSPETFLEILETRQSDLQSFEFVPPRPGDKHFGYFRVSWKWPRFSLRA
jgi:hypothetical protein